MSDATEILDTDYDTDSMDRTSDSSPYRSVDSLVAESITTLSTLDDIKTPDSTGLTPFHFHFDENPVEGPVGPHLFRNSEDSLEYRPQVTPDFIVETDLSRASLYYRVPKPEPERKPTPVPDNVALEPRKEAQPFVFRNDSRDDVAKWSPNQVVQWMQTMGFEDSVIEKFFINDISGSILLELQADDLKELEISSFGKRHQLMACIRQLRRSYSSSSPLSCDSGSSTPDPLLQQDTPTPKTTAADVGVVECTSPSMDDEPCSSRSGSASSERKRRHNRHKRGRRGADVVPEDSVSIVAIEQLLPKLHVCSKGENCRKWQKQQTRLARLLKDLQLEGFAGSVLVAGDTANTATAKTLAKAPKSEVIPSIVAGNPGNAATAQTLAKTPKSEVLPSIVASSDIMGPNNSPDVQLSRERLNVVQPRDPQENVRNFLNFQRLSALQSATDPATPPADHVSLADSPKLSKGNPTLAENLRHLPKLQIPSRSPSELTLSPNFSAQRTITPSILGKQRRFPDSRKERSPDPSSAILSPSDFYRNDPRYGQRTPLSSGDAPLTAIPIGSAVSRYFSQSVPPDMRFGGHHSQSKDINSRPVLEKADNDRRLHSAINGQNLRTLLPVAERSPLPPIETPEDLQNTPRAAHCRNNPFSPGGEHANDIIHSGWMKKRKTSKLIRHEWEDHHFTLRGTHLCMYPDQAAAQRDSKVLERMDVDDYAVACSSLLSHSKLTAAFKKTVLKRVNNGRGDATFTFSLIPSSNNSSSFERKSFLSTASKSHHFAVRTREERIDWMRELMLAKALRRGQENGDSVNLNGEPF
ncbi:hypothetical protein P175DRAFT_0509384 [Aspergillus ochraceoroseus IBT 24754]|nr:uncharacterized protein P175DRAFT_0509384 [Aspergillus ochraceoroseus IBT 24754]PTU20863.1 hypothetical protein P175DRAFT_0509384 [Aspergillus ochraceoroseus IBT 24754]